VILKERKGEKKVRMRFNKVVLGTVVLLAVLCIVSIPEVNGDVYGHNPRFSNNRLNETGQNRNNNNRLMDTQNNAKVDIRSVVVCSFDYVNLRVKLF